MYSFWLHPIEISDHTLDCFGFFFSIVLFETRIIIIMYSSGSLQGAMMFSSYVLVYY